MKKIGQFQDLCSIFPDLLIVFNYQYSFHAIGFGHILF